MDSNKWQQVEHLYHAALACEPKDRASLLDQADPETRREVERLLAQERPAPERTAATIGVGKLLGRYEIEARLGVGGMGEVFRARDTRLGRSVAIKTSQECFSSRFETEARAISALNHPHVCTLYDAGSNYLVMEFVEGETLAARLRRGGLPLEETLRYGVQIAEALAEAHAHGIVHRDLKPANIMLTRHGVKVLDFGLAKLLAETGLTQSQAIMGTPGYMAPEQVEGLTPSGATDLFAFGLVLFEMAAGRPPFPGGSLGWMLSTGAAATIPALPQQGSPCPPELDGLIRRLLARNAAERPASAGEVARELAALMGRNAAPAAAAGGQRKLALGVVVLLAAALSGGFWLYRRMEQRQWVSDEAIPEIARLSPQQPLAAISCCSRQCGFFPTTGY